MDVMLLSRCGLVTKDLDCFTTFGRKRWLRASCFCFDFDVILFSWIMLISVAVECLLALSSGDFK